MDDLLSYVFKKNDGIRQLSLSDVSAEVEKKYMIRILKTTWVNKTRASEMLGLRRKLYFPLEKHKILFIYLIIQFV